MNIFNLNPIHISNIIAAEKRSYPKGFSFDVRAYRDGYWHNGFYTLFYCLEGVVEYIFEDKTFRVEKDMVVFLDRYHPFTYRTVGGSFDAYLINFTAESGFIDEPVHIKPRNKDTYLSVFKEAATNFKSRRPGFELMTISSVMKLLGIIKDDFMNTKGTDDSKINKIVYATERMKVNIPNCDFSISQLADELHVSTSYLRKIFTEICGMPPIKYFKKMRIMHAVDILTAGEYTVSETAIICGYTDTSYFCRDFKKIMGQTPMHLKPNNR